VIRTKIKQKFRRHGYRPASFWEGRSRDLIDTYDHPETWAARGWLRADAEDTVVPELLRQYDCRRVLVPGAGSGRQYDYLDGFRVTGFDISPTLVDECLSRYPTIPTMQAEVVGCERFGTFDAVVTSAVLAHVPPAEIEQAVASVQAAATKLIVLREYTRVGTEAEYQVAHDYDSLFAGWRSVHRETTDDRDGFFAELIAYVP